jgi:hypothetical protein
MCKCGHERIWHASPNGQPKTRANDTDTACLFGVRDGSMRCSCNEYREVDGDK